MMKVRQIAYPNTARSDFDLSFYTVGSNCDEINIIQKNGEMAKINWFSIVKNGEVIAEIKESVCNVYF